MSLYITGSFLLFGRLVLAIFTSIEIIKHFIRMELIKNTIVCVFIANANLLHLKVEVSMNTPFKN